MGNVGSSGFGGALWRRSHLEQRIVKFLIIQTSVYFSFLLQCLTNARDDDPNKTISDYKPLRRATSWRLKAVGFNHMAIIFYIIMLAKCLLISLVSPNSILDSYQWLDCFILGRFKFIGRTSRLSHQILILVMFFFLGFRLGLTLFGPPSKFYACEFLLHDFDDILPCRKTIWSSSGTGLKIHHRNHLSLNHQQQEREQQPSRNKSMAAQRSTLANRCLPEFNVNSVLYLRNQFKLDGSREWILRPNRTAASWTLLNKWTRLIALASAGIVLVWIVLGYYLLSGSLVSGLGFEISYPACVAWLRDKQTNNSEAYAYIYQAPRVTANEMPIDKLPARVPFSLDDFKNVTPYRTIRILADLIENQLVYLDFILSLTAVASLLAIDSVDVIINANEIKLQLIGVLEQMESPVERQTSRGPYNELLPQSLPPPPRLTMKGRSLVDGQCDDIIIPVAHNPTWRPSNRLLGKELTRLQAIIADHFELTMAYNWFGHIFYMLMFIIWLGWSTVVFTWMSYVRSRAAETEFVITQSMSTIMAILLLSLSAVVRVYNLQLYSIITRIMAAPCEDPKIKMRWVALMNFYFPRPLYCMTLFNTVEISWLFNLKVSQTHRIWLGASALEVCFLHQNLSRN